MHREKKTIKEITIQIDVYLFIYLFFILRWNPTSTFSLNKHKLKLTHSENLIAQSAGAVEYTDCTSAEG